MLLLSSVKVGAFMLTSGFHARISSCCHTHISSCMVPQTADAALQDPRLLSYALRLRYSDFTKVDKIINDINAFLESHTGVDHKLPHRARLTDLATYSVDISITVSTACQQLTEP